MIFIGADHGQPLRHFFQANLNFRLIEAIDYLSGDPPPTCAPSPDSLVNSGAAPLPPHPEPAPRPAATWQREDL